MPSQQHGAGTGGFDAATTPIADQIALYRANRISYGQLGPNARARVNAQDAAAAAQQAAAQAALQAAAQAAAQVAAQAAAAAAAQAARQAAAQAAAEVAAQAVLAAAATHAAAVAAAAAPPPPARTSSPPAGGLAPIPHRPSGIVTPAPAAPKPKPAPVAPVFTGRGPPTGAGGNTGVVGSKPSHPGSAGAGPARTQKPWGETPEGAALSRSYLSLHDAFTTKLPGVRQQLRILASRPIGG